MKTKAGGADSKLEKNRVAPNYFVQDFTILLSIAFLILVFSSQAFGGDGIVWERLRLKPTVTISESYSDNVYLTAADQQDDWISSISPDISLDFAVAPRNYFTLRYQGEFLAYANTDNFRKDNHLGTFSFTRETAKGSHFILGASAQDTAIQPYSKTEQSKDYTFQNYYADIALAIRAVTEIGTRYSHSRRKFDDILYTEDDYTRDSVDVYYLYKYSAILPLLLQYRFVNQDNNDQGVLNTDFKSHTVFVGGRWAPGSKLSGALRVGYTWAIFEQSNVDNFDGYAVDTDLEYALSEIVHLKLEVEHAIEQPTRSERETGDYYEFKSVGLSISYKRWEKITTHLYGFYRVRDYKDLVSQVTIRQDTLYRGGLSIGYALESWISFALDFHHQQNNSDIDTEEYTENLGKLSITLSM
jgi:Putative beta-barrel porin 2